MKYIYFLFLIVILINRVAELIFTAGPGNNASAIYHFDSNQSTSNTILLDITFPKRLKN